MRTVSLSSLAKGRIVETKVEEDQTLKVPKKKNVIDQNEVIAVDLDGIVDLERIHSHVESIFGSKMKEMRQKKDLLKKLSQLKTETAQEAQINASSFDAISKDFIALRDEVISFENYFKLATYYLEIYKKFIPENNTRSVGENNITIDPENADTFSAIVTEFLQLAMKFTTSVKIVNKSVSIDKCDCGGSPVVLDGVPYCSSCNQRIKTKDASTSSTSSGSQYYRSDTMNEAMDEVQGRRKEPIPPIVYDAISAFCTTLDFSEENLSREEIIDILRKAKLNDYYKSVNLIRHVIQGRRLICFEHLRSKLIERHRLTETEFIAIRDEEGRSNFLNVYFTLRAFLQMEDFPIDPEDFPTLVTTDALKEQNRIMHILCARIREKQRNDDSIRGNWNFVSILN